MDSPQHCPGLESNKSLKTYMCKCSGCGKETEVFSDELEKKQTCGNCGIALDVSHCKKDAEA